MKITDVLSLITSGYNKEDLQTIKELAKESPDVIELAKQCKSMGDLNALLQLTEEKQEEKQEKPKDNPEEKPNEEPDYQKLYEDEKIKSAELEKKLKDTQEKATRTDVKERPKATSEDILKDIAKNFI